MEAYDGYDLFRRAVVERDTDAWTEIATRYRSLLISWACHSDAKVQSGECSDDLAQWALERAWAALSPARFAEFPNLAALLGYLRTCVTTTAIDAARARAARERVQQRLEVGVVMTPEQIILEGIMRSALWRTVSNLIETRQEYVILVESFVFDLPPRTILTRHPELFTDITAVYTAKRNLFARLQRNHDLRRLYDDILTV